MASIRKEEVEEEEEKKKKMMMMMIMMKIKKCKKNPKNKPKVLEENRIIY
jgi:hypothetical protein